MVVNTKNKLELSASFFKILFQFFFKNCTQISSSDQISQFLAVFQKTTFRFINTTISEITITTNLKILEPVVPSFSVPKKVSNSGQKYGDVTIV